MILTNSLQVVSKKLVVFNMQWIFVSMTVFLDVEPKNHEVLILKGWTLYAIGEVESAKDRFDEVLSIGYDNLEAFWGKARCNLTLGYDYDAIKDMNMVLKLTPNSSEGLMLRGKIKMDVQDFEGGLLDYKTIINLKEQ